MARSKPAVPAAIPAAPAPVAATDDAEFDSAIASLDAKASVTVVEDAPRTLSAQTLAEIELGRRRVREHASGSAPTIDLEAGDGYTEVDTKD